jgi:hypothetical protein
LGSSIDLITVNNDESPWQYTMQYCVIFFSIVLITSAMKNQWYCALKRKIMTPGFSSNILVIGHQVNNGSYWLLPGEQQSA